jgi:hypothetical protein
VAAAEPPREANHPLDRAAAADLTMVLCRTATRNRPADSTTTTRCDASTDVRRPALHAWFRLAARGTIRRLVSSHRPHKSMRAATWRGIPWTIRSGARRGPQAATRRSGQAPIMSGWIRVIALTVAVAAIAACGFASAPASTSTTARPSAPQAQHDITGAVDVGDGRRMFVECRGTGSQTVLIAGKGNGTLLQQQVADRFACRQ